MTTCEELDSIHKLLPTVDPSQQVYFLIHFTSRLKVYLAGLGLAVTYHPHNSTQQFMYVYHDNHKVHVVVDIYFIVTAEGYHLGTTHDSIQALVDHIQGVGIRYKEHLLEQARKQAVHDYCTLCYYCNRAAPLFCGMGRVMEVGCTYRQLLHGDGEQ